MARDRAIGAALVVGAIVGVIIYGSLMFLPSYGIDKYAVDVLKITAFVAIAAILGVLGWIGYVMATTPPPVPLEPEPTTTAKESSGDSTQKSGASDKPAT